MTQAAIVGVPAVGEGRRTKTETVSLRLDPKIRFMLEFLARIKGQSITAVVEHAVRDAASHTNIGSSQDRYGNETEGKIWSDFWDPSEGMRNLKLFSDPKFPTTYDEDRIRQFTLNHWQFFYTDKDGSNPRRGYVDILWPSIREFCELWDRTKAANYWAAGEAMLAKLRAARVAPPSNWPPGNERTKSPNVVDELDDDIPF
jgi:hypothetical protein